MDISLSPAAADRLIFLHFPSSHENEIQHMQEKELL